MSPSLLTFLIFSQELLILSCVILFWMSSAGFRKSFLFFGCSLSVTLVYSIASNAGYLISDVPTHFLSPVHDVLTVVLLLLMFSRQIRWEGFSSLAKVVGALFLIYSLIIVLFVQKFNEPDVNIKVIGSLILIGCSLVYFLSLIRSLPTEKLTTIPMFWIGSAVLLHYSGTLSLYLSGILILNDDVFELIVFRSMALILGHIYFSMVLYGLWTCVPRDWRRRGQRTKPNLI